MDLRLTEADLAELGLEGVDLGEPVPLERADVPGSHGYAATARTLDEYVEPGGKPAWSRMHRELAFQPQARDALLQAGFELQVSQLRPRLLYVVSADREPLTVETQQAPAGARAVLLDSDAPSAAVIDFAQARRAVIRLPGGDGLVVDARSDDPPVVIPFRVRALQVRPAATIDIPGWLTTSLGETTDTWLRATIESELLPRDAWAAASAVGSWARLRRAEPAAAREALARMLAGQVDEQEALPWRWARSLGSDQLATLERLALAEIESLDDAAESIADAIDPDDANWAASLAGLLHRRDQLEGVRLLLGEADRGGMIDGAVRALDRRLEPMVRSLPATPALRADERLARVAHGSPGAWWARPAVRP